GSTMISLEKWCVSNGVNSSIEGEMEEGTIKEIQMSTLEPYLVFHVRNGKRMKEGSLKIILDFTEDLEGLSITAAYVIAVRYLRKYNYRKQVDILTKTAEIIRLPSRLLQGHIRNEIKNRWNKKAEKLWKYYECDQINRADHLDLLPVLKNIGNSSWWKFLPPKDIQHIIETLRDVTNRKIEKSCGLTAAESQIVRNFVKR
ncbi:MAG: hypothetical protein ACFFD4_05570, partial [Candidatus Odinarchaeota archaeon]